MLKLRKHSSPAAQPNGMPLALITTDQVTRAIFPSEVIGSYRRMLTGLKYRGTIPERLALIAALRGEGVTYSALALGVTLASDLDARVCVVELNWWAPGMQAALANPPQAKPKAGRGAKAAKTDTPATTELPAALKSAGIAGVLQGTTTLDEALIATATPNLALLPAGDLPFAQRPILARSEALTSCLDELSSRFDYVVLDIPAIAATSDAVALASLAKGCCLLIQQGVTPAMSVRQSLDEVQHLPMLGVVLNRTHMHTPRWILRLLPQE